MRFRLAPLIVGFLALWIGLTEYVVAQTTGFNYQILVTIENGTGSTITDAGVPIVNSSGVGLLNWPVFVTEGYTQSDGDDIQFVDGANVIYGLAHTPANASDASWVRVQNLADGDTRTITINTGNPDATEVTVDQGIAFYAASDTVITLDDATIDLTDDLVVEVDIEIFDITTEAQSIRPLASKWDSSGTGYGLLLDPGYSIDKFEWGPTNGFWPDIAETTDGSGVFIITANNFIRTIAIGATGQIGAALIDELNINRGTGDFNNASIIEVGTGVFAFAYNGLDGDGFITTFTIASGGAITSASIDELEFDTSAGGNPEIYNIDGTTYAVAYTGSGNDGFIVTMDIQADGTIGAAVIDSFEFDTIRAAGPKLINVSGTTYALVWGRFFNSDTHHGIVATIDIGITGTIGTLINSLTFDSYPSTPQGSGPFPDIAALDSDTFTIVYGGTDDDGFIITVDIGITGTIGAINDTLEFAPGGSNKPKILNISGTLWVIVYTLEQAGSTGRLTEVTLQTDGTITGLVDNADFEPNTAWVPQIINVAGDVYAIAYVGPDGDGWLQTVNILPAGNTHLEGLN